ncbi:MAG TPA: TIGR02556 family CRISPR-associated protein, partial [Candidatus Cloacimonetes bacterium]|nr:TIGR02556 family CRISPR-associated protein [Candidatus Cloacimonadota bacterium]
DEFKNLKGLYKKNVFHNLSFNFGIIRTFFPKKIVDGKIKNLNDDFLKITTKILKSQNINKSFIYHQISNRLAENHRIEKSDTQKYLKEKRQFDYLKAMIFLKFLYELNLIEKNEGKLEVKMENKYEDYFQKHPDFYDADWKKAVFLTGVLAQNVMDIQLRLRGAKPFRSRLNGLKLDHKAIKRLLPESIEKLEQYKENYYRELEEVIALLMESGEPELKTQSVDEISFYFAMGMNLNKKFKTKKDIEGEHNERNN